MRSWRKKVRHSKVVTSGKYIQKQIYFPKKHSLKKWYKKETQYFWRSTRNRSVLKLYRGIKKTVTFNLNGGWRQRVTLSALLDYEEFLFCPTGESAADGKLQECPPDVAHWKLEFTASSFPIWNFQQFPKWKSHQLARLNNSAAAWGCGRKRGGGGGRRQLSVSREWKMRSRNSILNGVLTAVNSNINGLLVVCVCCETNFK